MKLTASALRTSGCMLIALLSIVGVEQAGGVSIGLFSTPDCSSCNLAVPRGETRVFYVAVLATDLPAEYAGFTGAELRVEGLPVGWSATSTPNEAATVVIGDPMGPGTDIAFGEVFRGTCIHMFQIAVTATIPATDVILRVVAHLQPADPRFPCPFIWPFCGGACDPPPLCVAGGSLFVNSVNECVVATQQRTWSEVKRLYD